MGAGYTSQYPPDKPDLRALERAFVRAFSPLPPPPTCAVGWQPSALTPVFYGVSDYGLDDGAPSNLRIFFPSVEGSVFSAPPLNGCRKYPVILFAHGHCLGDEADHYKKWFLLPAQLARSGYVVVLPQLLDIGTHPSGANHPVQAVLAAALQWVRAAWEHREIVLPAPASGIVGHSFGALHAAIFATTVEVGAVASLSGVWIDWPDGVGSRPITQLTVPQLFLWGTDPFSERDAILPDGIWNAIGLPKHRAIFAEGGHWDYLYTEAIPCNVTRGPCRHVRSAAGDLVTMFFAKYLPPDLWPDLPDRVPDTLIPPPLSLTPEQEFYAGGHLIGLNLFNQDGECRVTIDQQLLTDRTVPFVRFTPQAVARQKVLAADLVPKFTGPTGPGTPWVFSQSPAPGSTVSAGSTVRMQLRVGPIP
jgi:dienelactone hydrolase